MQKEITLPVSDITRFIPQQHPIVMIDELYESDGLTTVTKFLIKADGLFVEDNQLKEPGLIENIAQTAAAGMGYQFVKQGEPIPVGFIGAIKYLQITRLPKVGDIITTQVTVLDTVLDITLIKGEIQLNNIFIASCEMKIVLKK
ncbi:3-hydroxyacyl-ACP dehydratase [Xanthocytophaga agilis]|uniref:3-hydroxyacyl-ACP dehydratase n=1 Tax=Xanthocytophaga agilis TaxID=3048010 RepID=A0AAE3QZ77_9BACT|nr:3-hydroxyacyl-ACP dehydratase [Xanthocytophaga agilis]MDJ1500165.1 3-hydroxyacyl-ACP dehydratase [Xanthocytophaga agilis]